MATPYIASDTVEAHPLLMISPCAEAPGDGEETVAGIAIGRRCRNRDRKQAWRAAEVAETDIQATAALHGATADLQQRVMKLEQTTCTQTDMPGIQVQITRFENTCEHLSWMHRDMEDEVIIVTE